MKNTKQLDLSAPVDHSAPDSPFVILTDPAAAFDQDQGTRERVARSILEHGPSTAAQLAGRLGLTAAAVRRHLDVLLERGHVTAREERTYGSRGRGRPAKAFALTDVGRADFYTAYDDLAVQALTALAAAAGTEAIEHLATQRVAQVERRYAEITAAEPAKSPAQALADALTADGYVASTRPAAAGEQLCQHHCPVAHVAAQFPQLCEAETEVFSKLLGVHVQRLATIAHGDGVCTTHIPGQARKQLPLTSVVPDSAPRTTSPVRDSSVKGR